MTVTDIYNISQALYLVKQAKKADEDLEISDMINDEDLLEFYDSFNLQQSQSLEKFIQKHVDLYEGYPSQHQTDEDMEQRQYIIESIEAKIREELSPIFNF